MLQHQFRLSLLAVLAACLLALSGCGGGGGGTAQVPEPPDDGMSRRSRRGNTRTAWIRHRPPRKELRPRKEELIRRLPMHARTLMLQRCWTTKTTRM